MNSENNNENNQTVENLEDNSNNVVNNEVINEPVVNEPIVKDSAIIKKIVIYALPFIMIDIFKSLYNYVDMVTVVKGLVSIASFNIDDAEVVFSGHALHTDVTKWADGYKLKIRIYDDN